MSSDLCVLWALQVLHDSVHFVPLLDRLLNRRNAVLRAHPAEPLLPVEEPAHHVAPKHPLASLLKRESLGDLLEDLNGNQLAF